MRFRTLALVVALSVGGAGLTQAASKTTRIVGAERPKAKKAKKTKPPKQTKTAKAPKMKPLKAKPTKG